MKDNIIRLKIWWKERQIKKLKREIAQLNARRNYLLERIIDHER